MDNCHNCKNKQAEYYCDICRRSYCKQCDLYIHSLSSKIKHERRKLYGISQNKPYQTARNKYITDENGLYVYTGNTNKNYTSLNRINRNPLFEKENNNNCSPKITKNINYYENLSPKSNN